MGIAFRGPLINNTLPDYLMMKIICVSPWVPSWLSMAPQFPASINLYTLRTVLLIFCLSNCNALFQGVLWLFPLTSMSCISECLSYLLPSTNHNHLSLGVFESFILALFISAIVLSPPLSSKTHEIQSRSIQNFSRLTIVPSWYRT